MLGSGSAVIQLLLVVSSIIYSAADDGFGNIIMLSIALLVHLMDWLQPVKVSVYRLYRDKANIAFL